MTDEERKRINALLKEPPASISDFLTVFDTVTDGLDCALQSFLTTEEEKTFLRRLLSRLHGDRDRILMETYILNQTSPDCYSS